MRHAHRLLRDGVLRSEGAAERQDQHDGAGSGIAIRPMADGTRELAERLESWAQNEEMIDQHFTAHGQDCVAARELLNQLAGLRIYRIIRFRVDRPPRTTRKNITFHEARLHCGDPSTRGEGWFDGYDYMPGVRP